MTHIELDFEFMEALNALDLTRVQTTRKYREMCEATAGDCQKVDAGIAQMIEHNRKKRSRDPQGWAAIVETTAQFAAEERAARQRASRCESVTIEEASASIDDMFRANGANPRERRHS